MKSPLSMKERGDNGKIGKSVQAEAPHGAQFCQSHAAQGRPDDPGQIELNGVQCDGVLQIFLFDQRGDQSRVSGSSEGLCAADGKGEAPDVPHLDQMSARKISKDEGADQLDQL